MRLAQSVWPAVAIVAWGAAVAGGFGLLAQYKSTPSTLDGEPPSSWPAASRLARAGGPTLLFFAHPLCPCTRASLSELTRLMPRLEPRGVSAWVVVDRPKDAPADWDEAPVWERAGTIPGVGVFRDEDGAESGLFRAGTSGRVLLYDAAGRLQFSGGITASRGHEGTSAGQQRLLSIVETGTADRATSPVFGCALARNESRRD
jgi:hypothetical protein